MITFTVVKGDENAAELEGCQVGDRYSIEATITADDDKEVTFEADSLTKSEAEADAPEAEPEQDAGYGGGDKGGMKGMTAIILKHLK